MNEPRFQIAVLDRGFIYAGTVTVADGWATIENAQNIRRWGTSAGLGQLAKDGPQPSTRLDPAGTVRAPLSSVMHLIDADQSKWTQ